MLPLALAFAFACTPGTSADDTAGPTGGTGGTGAHSTAVLTTASMDFATGALATVDLDSWAVSDTITTIAGDAGVVADDGTIIQLNRYGYDSVRLYAPGSFAAPRLELSVADADGSTNPHDAALCDGRLFVSLYERSHLLVVDPDSGTVAGTVDLSAWDDGDGVGPEPSGMVEQGGMLYVALERLDRGAGWVDAGGVVVEVDCNSATATRSWEVGGNTRVYPWPGQDRVLAGARAFGEQGGGVYVIDPASDTVERVLDLDGTGTQISGLAADGDAAVLTTLADDYSAYTIHCADLSTGGLTLAETRPEFLSSVAGNDRGEAWISAHWGWTSPETASPGLVIYDIATCTTLTGDGPLAFSLAPGAVAFY